MIDGAIVIEESDLSAFTACREIDDPIGQLPIDFASVFCCLPFGEQLLLLRRELRLPLCF